jgi:hypothetical protein
MHAVESICGENWQPKSLPLFFEQVKQDLESEKSRAAQSKT